MNDLEILLLGTLLLCLVLTIFIMLTLRWIVKRFGHQIFEWYLNALDNKWFHALNVLIGLALLVGFWYGLYRLIF